MTKPELPPLSEAQLEIINIIWDRGTATVGQIWKTLAKNRSLSRNTISTMVRGWKKKVGCVIGSSVGLSSIRPRVPAQKSCPGWCIDSWT